MNATENKLDAAKINEHLKSGGVVQVTTYARSTIYTSKHAGWFTQGSDGIYVRQGRGKVFLGFTPIRLGWYR